MPGCVTKVGEIARLASASPVGQPRQSLCEAAPPSEMAYCGQLHASERRSLKRSLETAEAKARSLGGSVVASLLQVGTYGSTTAMPTYLPASPYTAVRQAIGAVFFRRSRLFILFHPSQATIPPNLTKSSSRYQK